MNEASFPRQATGFVIRAASVDDAPGIARVHVDTWRTTYPGLVPEAYLASLSHEEGQAQWKKLIADPPSPGIFCLVAEDPDQGIVGFASGGPARAFASGSEPDGEVYALYVLEPHQRRGIGRALVGQAARVLAEQGRRSLVIWVLAGNLSRAFYEALGGEVTASQTLEIGGARLEEVAYVWRDTSTLA